jgi:hypothetical protein
MRELIVIAVLMFAACSKSSESSSSSAGDDPKQPVSKEEQETFETYVVAFEKLVGAIDDAHGDCKAAVAAIDRSTKDLAKMAERGEALRAAVKAKKGDAAAGKWFGDTYGPRMIEATKKLKKAGEPCKDDEAFHSALDAAMAEYPMMKKRR